MVIPGVQSTNPKLKFRPMCSMVLHRLNNPDAPTEDIRIMPFQTLFRVIRVRLASNLQGTNDRRDVEIVPCMDKAVEALYPSIVTNPTITLYLYDLLLLSLKHIAQKTASPEETRIVKVYAETLHGLLSEDLVDHARISQS